MHKQQFKTNKLNIYILQFDFITFELNIWLQDVIYVSTGITSPSFGTANITLVTSS